MMPGGIEAHLGIRPAATARVEEIVAHGALVNAGNDALTVNVVPLGSPSLALEVVDAGGSPVPLPPPPVPGGESRAIRLVPGQEYPVEYPGFVPQWTPPGEYRARLRYRYRPTTAAPGEWTGELTSEWVGFSILPGM